MKLGNVEGLFRVPDANTKIFKDECAFSLDNPESPHGLFICLNNFIAIGEAFIKQYSSHTGYSLFLNYKIEKIFKSGGDVSTEPEIKKPTKLGIGVEGGFDLPTDKYTLNEYWKLVKLPDFSCLDVPTVLSDDKATYTANLQRLEGITPQLAECVHAVQVSESAIMAEERESAANLWEDENLRLVSKYAEDLKQLDNGVRISPSNWKCCQCGLTENLWLNLTDGSILCGRRFFDGSGGNNHAVEHYEKTAFPLAVKLGTITPNGAEVYSYGEDDMVTDPKLAEHLAHFGIDVMKMTKTDKTLAELEIDANERLGEWMLLQEADKQLEARFGPGLTGLRNLGNSCYINSVLQAAMAVAPFRWRYAYQLTQFVQRAIENCRSLLPVDDFGLQLAKLGYGMCSGAFSWPPCSEEDIRRDQQAGSPVPRLPYIRPSLFRRVVGRNHREFCTRRLQDALEFLQYFIELVEKDCANNAPVSYWSTDQGREMRVSCPVQAFKLGLVERLECGATGKVRYTRQTDYSITLPVPLEAATNHAKVAAWEASRKELESAGKKWKPEDVVRPRVPLEACVAAWAAPKRIEDWASPATSPPGRKTFALSTTKLENFPEYLWLQAARFTVGPDWRPVKLDVELTLDGSKEAPGDPALLLKQLNAYRLNLAALRGSTDAQPGEEVFEVADSGSSAPAPLVADESTVAQLVEMGFQRSVCEQACRKTANAGIEAAMNWVMEHPEGVPEANAGQPLASVNPENVAMLVSMGLTQTQATNVLLKFKDNLELAADFALTNPDQLDALEGQPVKSGGAARPAEEPLSDGEALYELVGLISHMGKSANDGHYVCHLKRSALSHGVPGVQMSQLPEQCRSPSACAEDDWIIFNDEKVARSELPPVGFAYLYLFRRVGAPLD